MEKLVQTIRLFRKKEDDIWSVFLLEFFKLIGCIVFDCILSDEDQYDLSEELIDQYDVNAFFELPVLEGKFKKLTQEKKKNGDEYETILIPVNRIQDTKEWMQQQDLFVYGKNYLDQLINRIWVDQEDNRAAVVLRNAYLKSRLFFYCYNKGNLKFVQEYYPLNGEDGRIAEKRKSACLSIYNQYADCYNELIQNEDEYISKFYYYQYALVNIRYELNSIRNLAFDRTVFYTDQLLKQTEQIKTEFSDSIRIHFLTAKICKSDDSFLWDAEVHFIKGISKFHLKYGENKAGDFLFYQFAKYYEKDRKENEKAIKYYQAAFDMNSKSYRAIYKLAKAEEQEKNYQCCIDKANQIIHFVLNGYKINELMPKQQIYIYKCYVLLGDIFSQTEKFDLAVISYQRALVVAETDVVFFSDLLQRENEFECEDFQNIVRACMPKQPIYLKIISSASKIRNMDLVNQYQEKLMTGEM